MTEQACTVHPTQPAPRAVKHLDQEHWCRACLDALHLEIRRRLKARGMGAFANKAMVSYGMMRVGKSGKRVE